MKTLKLFLILIITYGAAKAQMNPIATFFSTDPGALYFLNEDTGFVTSAQGMIYRTLDGGVNWDTAQTIFTTSWFHDIEFTTNGTGYACGGTAFGMHNNIIAKTTNLGVTWDSISANAFSGYDLNAISFIGDTVGLFAGQELVRTGNGGATFTTITVTPSSGNYVDVVFTEDSSAYLLGMSVVGGASYATNIYRSVDKGLSWYIINTDTGSNASAYVNALYFNGPYKGFAIGNNGICYKTEDAGFSWQKTSFGGSFNLHDMQFTSPNVGYIAATKSSFNYIGYILKTIDGGLTWEQDSIDSSAFFNSIHFVSDNIGYGIDMNKLFKTTNGAGLSIKSMEAEKDLIVYPNPVSTTLFFDFSDAKKGETQTVSIYSLEGKKLLEQKTFKNSIEVSELAPGLYFLQIVSKDGSSVSKFVKK